MLVLGDAHADDPANREALLAAYDAADADRALQVGDLGYYDLPVPTWFVAGNDDDVGVVEALRAGEEPDGARNARLLAGEAVELDGRRVAGLSGTYAPTRYEKPRSDLDPDRCRHFVREDVDRARGLEDVDVFLAHEAPHGLLEKGGSDVGCRPVDDVLAALEPDLCLVGHHHRHARSTFGPTAVVGLAPVWEGYYTLDPQTLALDRHPVSR